MKGQSVIEQIIYSIVFHAKPERAEELGSRLNALATAVREQPGYVLFNVHRVDGDPTAWFVYEIWRSSEDFERHRKTPDSSTLNADLSEILTGPPDALSLKMTSVPQ